MKILTVVGTRPELIRLSRVIHRLDNTAGIEHILVHTGQNYDVKLNEIFYDDLAIRRPTYMLGVDTSTLGTFLGGTLIAVEDVLRRERPDALLVLGDTNSSIAALIAKRMKVPVYHMEAGNRSFDLNVPEETNRRLVDHVSDFNLVYTEHARRNLLSEGLHPRRIIKTGSPMREVLDAYRPNIEASTILQDLGLQPRQYFVASIHREENVDSPDRLESVLECFDQVHRTFKLPIFVSTHPRTRKRLQAISGWSQPDGIILSEPIGFHDYNKLQSHALCCLSDSGTIAEESTILGFPAVTLRDSIERPEALETGGIGMTGLDPQNVVLAIRSAIDRDPAHSHDRLVPDDYRISNTSERVANFIISTSFRHHSWAGIRRNS